MTDPDPAPAAPAAAPAAPAASAVPPAPAPAPVDPAAPPAPPLGRADPAPAGDPAPAANWLDALPDDLKADKTLARFKSVEDAARGLIERQAMLGNRIELPKADDPDSFLRFAAAVRPESAEAYAIELPEGQDAGFADAMRPVFHDAGLHPMQVERLVKANNAYVAQQQQALDDAGRQELADLEAGMGKQEFEAAKLAANAWLTRMGIPVKFDTDLARMVGAGNSVRILFDIAARSGELGKVDGDDLSIVLGTMTPQVARAKADAIVNDAEKSKILNGPPGEQRTKLQAELSKYIKIIEAGTA